MNDGRTVISITKPTHQAVKLKAVELGITIQSAADQAFSLWLQSLTGTHKSKKVCKAQ